ncbi:hypothetical protein [Actinocrispum sp. NPDC049592]|uniref:hypothetical protein n=1 Tax=Actinocrispum sp. NPDC049592 TaxID=3154835 RepID=UPI00341FC6E0
MGGWLLRIVVAAALLGSAGIHLWLWNGTAGTLGALFLLNAIGGLVIAIAVLAWRHWLPGLAAFGFGVLTLGAYTLSATVGFMGVHDGFNSQPEYWGVITEAVCIIGGIALIVMNRKRATVGV